MRSRGMFLTSTIAAVVAGVLVAGRTGSACEAHKQAKADRVAAMSHDTHQGHGAGDGHGAHGSGHKAQASGAGAAHQHQHEEMTAAKPLPNASVYHLDQEWTDARGKKVKVGDLRGKPRLVSMVFTSCQAACPIIVADMKSVHDKLSPAERDKVGLVVFSFDPKRDTPEALAKFEKKMKLDAKNWTLLTGTDANVAEVAAVLGVRYKRLDSGDYIHSNVIYLLNAEGEIVAQKEGLKTPSETFTAEIKKTIAGGPAGGPAKAAAGGASGTGAAPAKK